MPKRSMQELANSIADILAGQCWGDGMAALCANLLQGLEGNPYIDSQPGGPMLRRMLAELLEQCKRADERLRRARRPVTH